jgi:hypothetical protein
MNRRKIFLASVLMTLIVCQFVFANPGVQIPDGKIVAISLPDPKLIFTGKEVYQANGQTWVRYNLKVVNFSSYPNALFAAAPSLPACGSNTNSSRTWIDVIDSTNGQRIYGFCALGQAQDLTQLWFAVKKGEEPPPCVHIVMTDRRLNKVYKSNRVCFPHTPPLGKADLTIKTFSLSPVINKSVKVQVVNIGTAASNACVLRLTIRKINGIAVARTTQILIPAILPGQDKVVVINAAQLLPNNVALKDTTFKLNVDATSIVTELNEANNEKWHNL